MFINVLGQLTGWHLTSITLVCVQTVISLATLLLLPKTPHNLVKSGSSQAAARAIRKIR